MEIAESSARIPNSPVAIIGMETVFGSLPSLRAFQEAVLNGRTNISHRPQQRWKGCDNIAEQYLRQHHMPGGFIKELTLNVGEFRIPPNEIRDILPQHLLMLKVAANAMLDAGLPLRAERPNMGAFIGIDFDFEATNFHLRWYLEKAVANWQANYGLNIEAHETAEWIEALKDACGPPLTASRTLGALGGIVASRIAREFGFGGPSFVVSCEEASGLKALEVAVRSLQQHETDTALVGAVDLRGDIRNIIAADIIKPFSNAPEVQPFDRSAQGSLPGEGAAALVLKRLDRATADEDRIYAVISGLGSANGGGIDETTASPAAYKRSLERCFQDADTSATAISFIETHGSGDPAEDRLEADALHEFFEDNVNQPAIGSTKPNIGHTAAVSGLGSLVKTAVCLYHEIIPPLRNFTHPQAKIRQENLFHFPVHPQYWFRNRKDGPRKALSSAITPDGNCMHVILEEADNNRLKANSPLVAAKIGRGKRKPLGFSEYGLFVVEGNDKAAMMSQRLAASDDQIQLTLGGIILPPTPPSETDREHESATKCRQIEAQKSISEPDHDHTPAPNRHHPASPMGHTAISRQRPNAGSPVSDLIEQLNQNMTTASEAHQTFLDLSNEITQTYAKTFALQTQLLELDLGDQPPLPPPLKAEIPVQKPAFDRELCLEFARGSVARVLGPEFAEVDTYAVRVRLPDEPLMLVDRILSVQGEKASLGPGRVVTEHDVRPGAWYLDAGHAPVCISVEAGQADLFLCSFLGIDLKVKGRRTYRLLDATVKFHRELPRPGETIRYEIEIEKFIRQGDTYLFLFQFAGYIGGKPLITMTNGCAGFFTAGEVTHSGGIIFTEDDLKSLPGKKPSDWKVLVPLSKESYDDQAVNALRQGNPAACFGHYFDGIELPESLRLPGGRLNLIDRVVDLDPNGGQFGLGRIRAEADIHPDDWFLTCHFVDDRVMPGTLMYECCVHTLRVFLLRLGWITDKPDVSYEPVPGIESTLKCRGPVTPETRQVIYEVDIKEIGYAPQPYVIADAHMYADGRRIVWFKDMCLQMNNVTRHEIEKFWQEKQSNPNSRAETKPPIFNRDHLIEFATGRPSKAFGAPYKPFDQDRFIARLPAPPYLFMDRLTHIEPSPWVLKPDGWIESEYDVTPDAWYVKADRSRSVPISIIMEIALQPCGWLAAYMGSALKSTNDLRFRNLGGNAVLHTEVLADAKKTLTVCARLTQVSEAGEMIIEHFDFEILHNKQKVYTGNAYFGFFSDDALAQQEGIREAQQLAYRPPSTQGSGRKPYLFQDEPPLRPDDQQWTPGPAMAYPAKAIRMIDRIHVYEPNGGPEGNGFVSGTKSVKPNEWFFKAHFYQDPVCPGSLGIESFVQLLKFVARDRWPHLKETHRFSLISGERQNWIYRGQILSHNKEIVVEAVITRVQETPWPTIMADGYLKVDELYIYKMENFGIQLVPVRDGGD
jgi:3-hydroxymyristoyl/3-hydroxydecanoyl-(acyl carrier protein) dehydratase/3-oxoacyl-(acyl-carrier-protein) synthase